MQPNTPAERGLIDTDKYRLRIKYINNKRYYTSKKHNFNDYFYFIWLPIIKKLDIVTQLTLNKQKH